MKRPSWLRVKHIERTDQTLVYTLRIKRNWALWKFLWHHVHAPGPLKIYIVARAWFKF